MNLKDLKINTLPSPPRSFIQMIGPSLILVGLGLGTGELILWPYLTSNWGLGIIWGALLGISMQFFLNMEIERYTLGNGESVFVGFARFAKRLPYWFVASSVLAWSWPAFSSASAAALKPFHLFGTSDTSGIAMIMMLLVGVILTLGPVLYKTVETFQRILISIGIPIVIFVAFKIVHPEHIVALFKGLLGIGDGYFFFPLSAAFPFMSFLAALTYSGAGGNLLLAQSFYVKEKGYGMGKYAGRITSLITGKTEPNSVLGTTYVPSDTENKKFNTWWRMANIEHGVVFWGLGLFTMLLLALISYSATYGNPANATGINFIYAQAEYISKEVGPIFASLMLIVTSLMLFATQLTVIDAAGRIITENIVLIRKNDTSSQDISRTYYLSIWTLIAFGIVMFLFGVSEPQFLIVTGAVINAVCMFVFAGLLIPMNKKLLPQSAQPNLWRQVVVWSIFIALGLFTFLVIGDSFLK